jgi:2-keto-4-pentenoate hydratase/2-oxohepta-3-ene-1,7-dioic acid hydratase in catechol pathway
MRDTATDAGAQVGIQIVGEQAVRVPAWLRGVTDVLELIRRWDQVVDRLACQDPSEGELTEHPELLLPLRFPPKVLCSGPNYTDHLAEMGESSLGDSWTSYFFFKPPTTALAGPGAAVVVAPTWKSDRVDWEGELAVVIGAGGRDIERGSVWSHVAGYTVANDISLRGPHRRDTPAAPFVWDWAASKAADTSCPIGPGIVPASQVADPQELAVRTWVNGDLKQDGSTANMVLDVASLVSDASRLMTLEPGDLILTGTPAGVGFSRGEFLSPGDIVEVEISGIGRLVNHIEQRPGT